MDIASLLKFKEMLVDPNEEQAEAANAYQKGSVLNPGSLAGGERKEIAKPFTKIEATINTRNQMAPPIEEPIKEEKKEDKKKLMKPTDIWDVDEVKDIPVDKNESRMRPEFEVMFRQKLGTEDVYLGMSDIDPSSTKCQELLMKVYLPKTRFKDVSLDVTDQVVCIQSSKYYLYHILPYKVNDKEGKAQWVSDKEMLTITLPIIRDDPF